MDGRPKRGACHRDPRWVRWLDQRLTNGPTTRPNHTAGVHRRDAETCSFVVLNHYGIDTSSYSFPYVVFWTDGDCQMLT